MIRHRLAEIVGSSEREGDAINARLPRILNAVVINVVPDAIADEPASS